MSGLAPTIKKRTLVLLSLLAAALLVSFACRKETEEDKVRKAVTSVQRAAGEKKVLAVLEHVSKTYRDPQGNDYEAIKGLMLFYFYRHQKVSVAIPAIDVTVTGPDARAVFRAILAGKGGGEETTLALLPEALGVYDFDVRMKKEDGKWMVTSAEWKRVGEGNAP